MALALPKPSPHTYGSDIFVGFSAISNTWISLLFVFFQFYPQLVEFRRMSGSPGSLSLLSLGMRAIVMVAIAVRWFLRLEAPTWRGHYAPPTMWYQWGWLPFNYVIEAFGCVVVLGIYLGAGHVSVGSYLTPEERPLLP